MDSTTSRAGLLALLAIAVLGFGLRLHELERIFLWYDETAVFDARVWGEPPVPALEFARDVHAKTTYSPGWPFLVCVWSRLFGSTAAAARSLSALLGAAAIPVIAALAGRMAAERPPGARFASLAAGILAAISIPAIEFSQRLYPYAAVPLLAALIAWLHLDLAAILRASTLERRRLLGRALAYALLGALAIWIHASLVLVVAASSGLLGLRALAGLRARERRELASLAAVAIGVAAILGLTLLANLKDPKEGFRPYLVPYYHPVDFAAPASWLGALRFLAARTYDAWTYHLDLFYDRELYWPRSANLVLLPLVLACVGGWILALLDRWWRSGRELALLALALFALPAALSLVRRYPYGGVRQLLFLAPFLLAFAALGLSVLWERRALRPAVLALVAVYLGTWAWRLPHFYSERTTPFEAAAIEAAWEHFDRPAIYADGGCKHALDYLLREHAQIAVDKMPAEMPAPPFLVVSTHWPIELSPWRPDLVQEIARAGGEAALVLEVPPAHPYEPDYRESLYHPPNGLWLYEVHRR